MKEGKVDMKYMLRTTNFINWNIEVESSFMDKLRLSSEGCDEMRRCIETRSEKSLETHPSRDEMGRNGH